MTTKYAVFFFQSSTFSLVEENFYNQNNLEQEF